MFDQNHMKLSLGAQGAQRDPSASQESQAKTKTQQTHARNINFGPIMIFGFTFFIKIGTMGWVRIGLALQNTL